MTYFLSPTLLSIANWLGRCYTSITIPDLAFVINWLCQHMHRPMNLHHRQLKRVLCYLCATVSHGVHINPTDIHLTTYNDSDWAGDISVQKSTTRYIICFGNIPTSWAAKKQLEVSHSSTKVEYRALASSTTKIQWIHHLLSDFCVLVSIPTPLFWDNLRLHTIWCSI